MALLATNGYQALAMDLPGRHRQSSKCLPKSKFTQATRQRHIPVLAESPTVSINCNAL